MLREKMVEIVADKFIVIVDESKLCDALGPGQHLCGNQPVRRVRIEQHRVDGVEDDAMIQRERAVK